MKTQNTLFNLFLMTTLLFCLIQCKQINAKTNSKIGIDYKIGVNYVTHLYTLGNIGYNDSEYAKNYAYYLSEDDKQILQQHKDLLIFGQGKVGSLTPFFFFIPAYADLKTQEEYKTYFENISTAIDKKSFKPIEDYIPDQIKEILDNNTFNELILVRKELNEISEVYIKNFKLYKEEIYPKISKELEAKKNHLNNRLDNNNIIDNWQRETNYNWDKGDYIYLLFRAGKNGPSFNNLSDNINSCYYKIDENYIVDMFSHEFGIFLMYDSINPLMEKYKIKYPEYKNKYTVGRVYWMAYEMLSIFFNIKINNKKTLDYYSYKEADPIAFMEIYSNLYKEGIVDPKELYTKGILEYMKPNGYWKKGVKERYEKLK